MVDIDSTTTSYAVYIRCKMEDSLAIAFAKLNNTQAFACA